MTERVSEMEGNYIPDPDLVKAMDFELGEPVLRHPELFTSGMEKVNDKDIQVEFGLVKGEKLYYCPYQRSHQVLLNRYSQHLQKCRHNYLNAVKKGIPVVKIEICPFRPVLHHMSDYYMKRHVLVCPDRQEFVDTMRAFSISVVPPPTHEVLYGDGFNPPSPKKIQQAEMTEVEKGDVDDELTGEEGKFRTDSDVWFDDEVGSYDPKVKLSQGFYYTNPQGLTKSEKREYRKEEAKRFEKFKKSEKNTRDGEKVQVVAKEYKHVY